MANFENITIEKGMYQTKGGISGALEKLDPSENYRGTALEGLDAFSRQLKRFDIKVKGRNSDCVEKFFQSSNSAALFPEYVSRAVMQGMERADILPNLVATVTDIEGMDYRSIASVPSMIRVLNSSARVQRFRRLRLRQEKTLLSFTSAAECLLHHMRRFAFSVLTSLP